MWESETKNKRELTDKNRKIDEIEQKIKTLTAERDKNIIESKKLIDEKDKQTFKISTE